MENIQLVRLTDRGLYCENGGFFIDPSKPVDKALITHAHSDHARAGAHSYLTVKQGKFLIKQRLGSSINLETINYGQEISINGVKVSFHPAGHILGSSQIRIEYKGEIWVISGDYKIDEDITCDSFTTVKCHTFITESTFGLPIYKWSPQKEIFDDINSWWRRNKDVGIASIIFSYSLGKSQRIIAGLDESIGPIFTDSIIQKFNICYAESGIKLPLSGNIGEYIDENHSPGAIFISSPSTDSHWAIKFRRFSSAIVSGWMLVRKNRKRSSCDRGFPLSDHADWDGLLQAVKNSEADRILVTHGYSSSFARWLRENGFNADVLGYSLNSKGENIL
jgi:putative mRNA 3-end processing factor